MLRIMIPKNQMEGMRPGRWPKTNTQSFFESLRRGGGGIPIVEKADRQENLNRNTPVPFGTHSTGQDIGELEERLSLRGEILSILDAMNAIRISASEEEVDRLRRHPEVRYIEPVTISVADAVQNNPGSALDRIDEEFPGTPDNTYTYTNTGASQTIYILDTGLDVGKPYITSEFGSRASVIHDFNGGAGEDCADHGTPVSSLAAGDTYGVAKGATLIMAKISSGCTIGEYPGAIVDSLNWLAANESPGTIVNISFGPGWSACSHTGPSGSMGAAVKAATQAGIMVFTSAGNDGCSIDNYFWKDIPEAFVVGGLLDITLYPYWPQDEDRRWSSSNYGANISTWAPSEFVASLTDDDDSPCSPPTCGRNGTSFASPIVAGMAAVACESVAPDCALNSVMTLYEAFRDTGTMGTVLDTDGSPLTSSPSRVIWQQW